MMWAALGLIFAIRLLSGMEHGWSAGVLLLTMVPYPPLVVLLARTWPRRMRFALFGLVAGCAALPFAVFGTAWDWLPWTVGVAILVAFRGRVAAVLFFGLLGAVLCIGLLDRGGVAEAIWRVTATVNDGLIILSLYSLAGMVRDLTAAQGELARLATLRERLRLRGELRTVVGGELRAIGELLSGGRDAVLDAVGRARRTLRVIREAAAEYRTAGIAVDRTGLRSPRITRLVLFGVLCMMATSNAVQAGAAEDPVQLLVVVPVLVAIIVLYMVPRFRFQLALIALLTFPMAWPGAYVVQTWVYIGCMWGFFAGLALVRLRPPASLLVVVGTLVLDVVVGVTPMSFSPTQTGVGVVSDLILAGLVYSLTRLGELVAVLDRARRELAEEAVARERVRLAGDLHDVLGFSLSAVALRGELALRLLERDPERAAHELTALRALVDQSAAELDSITDGRIRLRLAEEIEAAREVLAAAGVAVETTVATGHLDRALDTAVAAVLRESVTNVLRHSEARSCTISVVTEDGLVRLTIVNDGAVPSAPMSREGTGLSSLASRTAGRLTAGPLPDGRFELVAEFGSDPTGLAGDADGVDAIAGAELGHR